MLKFRRSTPEDMDAIVRIAEEGKAYLKRQGIDQWQRGTYPDREIFLQDERNGVGCVVTDEDRVVAVCAVILTGEADYRNLTEGRWLTADNARYAAVHRIAVSADCRGKHLSTYLFEQASALAARLGAVSVRVDTHPDNVVMQGALKRAGFVKCGPFIISEGDEAGTVRWGYERML